MEKNVEERFERIERILEETNRTLSETNSHLALAVQALQESFSGDRERAMRLDKLESELDALKEKRQVA